MYSRGLQNFLQKKKVKSSKVIAAFLKEQEVVDFTHKNHRKVNNYLQDNWSKFASFVDKGIKSGEFRGDSKPINPSLWKEVKEENIQKEEEFQRFNSLSGQEKKLYKILKERDDLIHLGCCISFFHDKEFRIPQQDYNAVTRKGKIIPKLQAISRSGYIDELIEFLTTK